ncbi:MAG: isoprenoid biosynthesis glyoxalase ElbB [Candidatus Marinimicrobia bacterium]|jgi:enhancing lycopene biosynthesis protein 2|nr:isoprenoid biosynthesis glyoxalase ElbB [Candidatus Neomarinimicrobiota bacterium]MDD4961348.1 isoprenoid biosynthesis glyoxalase ElbB [Candidatus Neomarinimicrobiota bacterium]MDD5709014.1 isoprenoid biosynthesis glyoxalase ElbB [Candidatus Neomarinimicrobiota bacterium]MDX9777662.1 isoprenoid biosynthesis glyoxalase ElbB [bacterium]
MKPVAVILSGCGRADGSEIHESVFTLLALSRRKAAFRIYAPNRDQARVINHFTGEESGESRNILVEAARIARGNILPLSEMHIQDVSAIILPGGQGASLNFWDYFHQGIRAEVDSDMERVLSEALRARMPLGFICIAPVLAARIAKITGKSLLLTIGKDPETAADIEALGCRHQLSEVHECVVDAENRVVSTAAYMSARTLAECNSGIEALVNAVCEMAEQ